jgi:hypothetical protein
MPSCSGNHKQAPMTGGGIRSMLRRAKSGLRKLTKRNKPTKPTEEFEMVDITPKVASTRFGSKSRYNSNKAHRQAVNNLEGYVGVQRNALTRHGKFKTEICQKATEKLEQKNIELEKKNAELRAELGAAGAHVRDAAASANACHKKDFLNEQLAGELEAAVAKLAECESGKASLGRRHAAAAKMYRAAHVERTLGALETEDALDKAIEAEELLAKANIKVAELQGQHDRAIKHAGTKSEKKSNRRKFAQNIAHGALDMEQKRAAGARLEADAALNMLQKVTAAGMSNRRRAESAKHRAGSAERRTQRILPIPKLNIALGSSSMALKRSMRNTNAVANSHNAFMAQQKQKHIMNEYKEGRRANADSLKITAPKAELLAGNNALTLAMKRAMKKK